MFENTLKIEISSYCALKKTVLTHSCQNCLDFGNFLQSINLKSFFWLLSETYTFVFLGENTVFEGCAN